MPQDAEPSPRPTRSRPERPAPRADAGTGSIYGLAFIGALIYFLQHATSVWDGLWGVVKAIFWPAVIMYEVLGLLKL